MSNATVRANARTMPLNRRSALGCLAAASASLAATGAGGNALASAHLDTTLLSLGREFEAAWAWENAAFAAATAEATEDENSVVGVAVRASAALVDRILEEPAKTLSGLKVKARAVCWCRGDTSIAEDEFDGAVPSTDMRAIAAILRDLLAAEETAR